MTKPRILDLFFFPPQAIARLGASVAPLENYLWDEDPSIPGAARTVIEPAISLDVSPDGSVHPYVPALLRFKDGGLIRPVAPFFELWAVVSTGGQTTEEMPVTSKLLEDAGASMESLTFTVTAANLKAARRCGDPNCGYQAELRVIGNDHQRHPLRASSPSGKPGGEPLVMADRPIPLGSFQVLLPKPTPEMGVDLDVVRVRYTPAAGEVYGPPSAIDGPDPDNQRVHTIVKPENRILNPSAEWLKYDADTVRFRNPEPGDTYDGADTRSNRSLGVVDDTCEGVIAADLKIGGIIRRASARVFVGPPDFAPDRRPFVSLADELADRDLATLPVNEPLPALERRINDLFLRALETASLFNLDAARDRFITRSNTKVGTLPRTDAGSMTAEDRPFASLTADLFADRKALRQASTKRAPLPLTEVIEEAHAKMADLDVMITKLREDADRIRLVIRPPFGRVSELAPSPGTVPAADFRDPRVDRDAVHDMRMPPFMRDSDADPLSLTHRQYAELFGLVKKLTEAKAAIGLALQSAGMKGAARLTGRKPAVVHPAELDTPIRRRIGRFIEGRSEVKEYAIGKARKLVRGGPSLRAVDATVGASAAASDTTALGTAGKIFPLNLTARAAYRVPGNPESTRLESGVGNCYPGLEFDHRNLDRRFLPGLVVEFVSSTAERLQGCRLLDVDPADPGLTPDGAASAVEVAALKKLTAELTSTKGQLLKGDWFVTALTQGGRRIELSTTDNSGRKTPLDGMTTWRLARSLEPAAVDVELTARSMPAGTPLPASPIVLHGWRRRFTDAATGVLSAAYQPGELTQSLCSPWTHDFRDCACVYWASNHPDVVHVEVPQGDPVMSGGSPADPKRGLLRADWLRSDRSFEKTAPARETEELNRPAELDHYEINQRWQDLDVVLADREISAVYQPRVQDSAEPFASPRDLARKLTELATMEHVLAVEYLYAYYSVRTVAEISGGPLAAPLRDDVEFIRHHVQLVAVNEMQHLRAANQMLWELANARLVDRDEFGPSLGVSKTVPDSNKGGERRAALRPLTLDVLLDFVAVERPSGTIEGAYAQVVATLRRPEYPDALYQLASRIVNEGQEHFLRFRDIEFAMRQYERDKIKTPWLRDVQLVAPSNAKVKPALALYKRIVDSLVQAYATGSVTDRRHITEARDDMAKLDTLCDRLAARGTGVPFF